MAMVTGTSPRPTPWKARPPTGIGKLFPVAASTHPARSRPSETSTTWRCFAPSASRPMPGVTTAPARSAAVSSHWAVLSGTFSDRAITGIRGAPKLLTTALVAAMKMSVGVRALDRHDRASVTSCLRGADIHLAIQSASLHLRSKVFSLVGISGAARSKWVAQLGGDPWLPTDAAPVRWLGACLAWAGGRPTGSRTGSPLSADGLVSADG